jgi:ribose transport system permease protein
VLSVVIIYFLLPVSSPLFKEEFSIGAIFGALAFRTIGDLLFVFDFDPLWQPLFQGVVLMFAVSLGAFGLFRVRNKLEWFQ